MRPWFKAALVLAVLASPAHATEKQVKLFKQGYRLAASGIGTYDGCEDGKIIELSPYKFKCGEFHYSYHYGSMDIMANSFVYNGATLYSIYLCPDEGDCIRGELVR